MHCLLLGSQEKHFAIFGNVHRPDVLSLSGSEKMCEREVPYCPGVTFCSRPVKVCVRKVCLECNFSLLLVYQQQIDIGKL